MDNLNIIHNIKMHILSDPEDNLNKKFNHFKQKYTLDELLNCVLLIHMNGISYRNISNYTNINWNTIYKFKIKLRFSEDTIYFIIYIID